MSSKDPRHEELSLNTAANPDVDKTGDALPTNASEPELITAQNTTNIFRASQQWNSFECSAA
jgi:hypothetical protein